MYCDNLSCQHERAILGHQARRRGILNVILLCALCWAIVLGLVL